MASFFHAVILPSAPAEVFPWLLEEDKVPRWVEGVQAYEVVGGEPLAAGARLRQTLTVSGYTMTLDIDVVEYRAPDAAVTRSEMQGIAVESVYRVEPEGEGARVTQAIELDAKGMTAKLIAPMVRKHMEAKVARDLGRLRDLLS
jgi:carbon monoxide dehydrogenase subunit G